MHHLKIVLLWAYSVVKKVILNLTREYGSWYCGTRTGNIKLSSSEACNQILNIDSTQEDSTLHIWDIKIKRLKRKIKIQYMIKPKKNTEHFVLESCLVRNQIYSDIVLESYNSPLTKI